jgi:hypothetical protein
MVLGSCLFVDRQMGLIYECRRSCCFRKEVLFIAQRHLLMNKQIKLCYGYDTLTPGMRERYHVFLMVLYLSALKNIMVVNVIFNMQVNKAA